MIIFCLSFRAQPRNQRGAIQERTRDPAKVRLNRGMRALCTRRVGKQHAYSNRPSRFHTLSPLPLSPSRAKRAQGKLRFLGFARNDTTKKCTEKESTIIAESSSGEESHPSALTEPDVRLSP